VRESSKYESAAILIGFAAVVSGCATPVRIPAARPLPEVRFVAPSDPTAVIALSAEDELNLQQRDRLLQDRIRTLEELLQSE